MIDLARYDAAVEDRERNWAATDEALYYLCKRLPGHQSANAVNAKLSIIARAYSTGIERKIETPKQRRIGQQDKALTKLAQHVFKGRSKIDAMINTLAAMSEPLTLDNLRIIVREHGRFVKMLRPLLIRGQSSRSFVSKYLHFHAPLVPVYDSRAAAALRRLCPWRKDMRVFDMPAEAEKEYGRFAMRFWRLYEEARAARDNVTVKRLDYYLLKEYER